MFLGKNLFNKTEKSVLKRANVGTSNRNHVGFVHLGPPSLAPEGTVSPGFRHGI